MKRDGATFSLWQANIPDYIPQNRFEPDKVYDVLIVGAGNTGVTTAFLLQQAGKNCIIAEAHNPGFGTTGGTTAHLNTMIDTTYDQIESDFGKENTKLVAQATKEAIQLVARHVQTYQIDCGFSYRDAYLYSQDEKESKKLDKIVEAAQRAGVEVDFADTIPIPDQFEKVARFKNNAQFHPTRYISALLQEYEKLGGVIRINCLVQEINKEDYFTVETTLGTIKAHKIVYATHLPPGVNVYSFQCAPYRSYAMAVQLAEGHYPEALAYDMKDPYHYHRTQEVEGKPYLIVGGFDHKTGHEPHTQKSFIELEAYIRGMYEVQSVDYKWSSQYFEPVDGLPYIGEMAGAKDRYVATGFSGTGITLGTVSAIVLSDLLTKGESPYEKVFNASRIKPLASFTNFVKEQADVIGQFISKRFQAEKIQELAALAPGEAKIVKYEGEKLALYKDEKGALHAVDPVCPHAKCFVGWNDAEKSWDCPCHGSRFDVDGNVLTGPTRNPLKKIEMETFAQEEQGRNSGSRG